MKDGITLIGIKVVGRLSRERMPMKYSVHITDRVINTMSIVSSSITRPTRINLSTKIKRKRELGYFSKRRKQRALFFHLGI